MMLEINRTCKGDTGISRLNCSMKVERGYITGARRSKTAAGKSTAFKAASRA